MDAATAAAMSNPDRNPHFRRRWTDGEADASALSTRPSVGTFGLALLEALRRRRLAEEGTAVSGDKSAPPR